MAREKNQKKIAFYKQRRKSTPGITDEQLRSMWKDKVDAEAAAKKAEEEAKKPKPVPVADPAVVGGAAIAETLAPSTPAEPSAPTA